MDLIVRLVSPELEGDHAPPPFVLLKMPPIFVPAKTVDGVSGSMANERIVLSVIPALIAPQLAAASVLLAAPPLTTRMTPEVTGRLN